MGPICRGGAASVHPFVVSSIHTASTYQTHTHIERSTCCKSNSIGSSSYGSRKFIQSESGGLGEFLLKRSSRMKAILYVNYLEINRERVGLVSRYTLAGSRAGGRQSTGNLQHKHSLPFRRERETQIADDGFYRPLWSYRISRHFPSITFNYLSNLIKLK